MIKLFRYLKGTAIIFAVMAPLMMILEVSMDLMQPTLMAAIIDKGIGNADSNYVISTGIKMVIAAVLGFIGGTGCSFFASAASVMMGQKLRQGLFDKIQDLSFQEIDRLKTASLITRLTNDVTQVQNMVLALLRSMVRSPLLCIGGFVMSYLLAPKLAILLVVALVLIFVALVVIIKVSFPLFLELQRKIDGMNMVMRENILGVRVIRVFNIVSKQINRFNYANEGLMEQNIKAQNLNMMLWPIVTFIMNMTVIASLWYGGGLVNNGVLGIGVIMAFINYAIQIMNALMAFANALVIISRAKASIDRINEVFEMEPGITESAEAVEIAGGDIEFRNVYFRYNESSEYALSNIDFTVKEGESIGIIGSTGSGKSTLVSLIGRLYDVTDGEIRIGGSNIKDIRLDSLRSGIALVTQENTIFSGTIQDNIVFGSHDAQMEDIIECAKDAEAYEFIMKKNSTFAERIEQRGMNLSGGQKQRLSIARALARNAKIFIMDDSTSALDMATEARLQHSVKQRFKNNTIIIIAQRISGVMDADKILVLDEGRIVAIGNHRYLLENCEIYRNIAASQLGEDVCRVG